MPVLWAPAAVSAPEVLASPRGEGLLLVPVVPWFMVKDVQKAWAGDALTFSAQAMGQPISGVLTVFDQSVRMDIVLPGLLGVIAGKITGQVKKQGQLLLEKK